MKILITGGMGFIGSAMVRLAIHEGHTVMNIDCLTYAGNLGNVAQIKDNKNYQQTLADIRDRKSLDKIFTHFQPDAVMHFAAESHVDRSIDGPESFITTNINGTYNLLEAARNYWKNSKCFPSFRFHHISTDEVYGELGETGLFTEKTPYQPSSPYSASKAASDHLVRAWNKTFDLPTLITNCSNNYGPFHFPEKLIPTIILSALHEQEIPIYGDGSNVRDWLYVEDHAKALILTLMKGTTGSTYNIGGFNECSNIDLAIRICEILDELVPRKKAYSKLIQFVKDRPGHDFRYAIDSTKIREELGWKPLVDLDQGLQTTIKWYLENKHWWKPLLEKTPLGKKIDKNLL
ncbi:MAG: dTDP-glucose 4,6-dehydratase [Bdellovibrionales bacterium]|nr:dTDP-glucose 4,6-dehydratase [Bdellovibrionales bacterium]